MQPGLAISSSTSPETDSDIAMDDYLDCISQIGDAMTRANARLESMVDKGRLALNAIDEVKDGAKGRVLGAQDEEDAPFTVEPKALPNG